MTTGEIIKKYHTLTPKEIVAELDKYIIGQEKAKKAVAIALRNRWRRQQVDPELRDEIAPKNIIMIGPTGVGKTEIARRLANLAQAPFIKVEASKFTEVGYVGRDVDSMIRDLLDRAIQMVKKEAQDKIKEKALLLAEERVIDVVMKKINPTPGYDQSAIKEARESLKRALRLGELDDNYIEISVEEKGIFPMIEVISASGIEDLDIKLHEMFQNLPGIRPRIKKRKVTVKDALKIFQQQEAEKLIDMDKVIEEAKFRTEQTGIVFIDEIDKIAARYTSTHGPDVSREGVQRDLLPIVEGTTVNTKYGPIKTDHILFIAAGAFHITKPSDLIPELQGRFPIRVELESLGKEEFARILVEPKNALIKQYKALLKTEDVNLEFTKDAIESIAEIAAKVNEATENIGARRLHTVMEALLEELSFNAPNYSGQTIVIDSNYVREKLSKIVEDQDLSRYIL